MSQNFFRSPLVCPSTIRIAEHRDEVNLRAMLDRLHAVNPNPGHLPVSDRKVWAHVNAACRKEGAIAGVIDHPNGPEHGIIGSIGIFYVEPWWSEVGMLSQSWLYVDAPFRASGRRYRDLIKFARWHRADMSVRLGYNIGLENSFLTADGKFDARARLWGQDAKAIGMLFWTDN